MSDSVIPPKLLAGQEQLFAAVEAIEAMVAKPHPGSMDTLAPLRWTFTREAMLHFAAVESLAIQPLLRDRRADAAALAVRSSADLVSVHEQFLRHANRWQGLPPAERWGEYRAAIGVLMRRVRTRLAAEARELFPLLPAQPGDRAARPLMDAPSFASEAWKVRAMIYRPEDGEQRAII